MPLKEGTRLGPYEILAPLGAGGMGEVYRARDTRLGREVAIKVLPAALASDPDRLKRFEREARSASALNHPNIVTIYDIGAADSTSYIAMELVNGESLHRVLQVGALPVRRLLQIGAQIAEGLAKAHAVGIVHRDLKPENVMVTEDGLVKILDFGLAKLTQPDSSGTNLTQTLTVSGATGEGVILGTVGYMSPEQATGGSLDYRSDQFSFGSILYEMATGRRAFVRASAPETLTAIIREEPEPMSTLNPKIPAPVRWVIERCLAKQPRSRYASTEDLARDLVTLRDRLSEATSAVEAVSPVPRPRRLRWRIPAAIAAVILLALGIAGWRLRQRDYFWKNPLAGARFTRFTDWEGSEFEATISGDGKFVAFISDRGSSYDVWVGQVGGGDFLNLSKGQHPSVSGVTRTVGFSDDGAHVVWSRTPEDGGHSAVDSWLAPTLGGLPRPFLKNAAEATWSPDRTRLLFHTMDPGDPVFIADRNGGNPVKLFEAKPGIHNHYPIWSPDGRFVYFVRGIPPDEMDVWRTASAGGPAERLTHHNSRLRNVAMLDDRTLIYSAPREDQSGPGLYALDVDRRISHAVTSGLEEYLSVSASADGRRLAATVANPTRNLWKAPITDHVVGESAVSSFGLASVRAAAPRFGPDYVLYLSPKGGKDGLWKLKDGSETELWTGNDGAVVEAPAVSPDGTRICFVVQRESQTRLYLMASDGTGARPIAESLDVRGVPSWSPDGKWVAVVVKEGKTTPLLKAPVDGGAPARLVDGVGVVLSNPVWSPDGRFILYSEGQRGATVRLRGVAPDGQPFQMPEVQVQLDLGDRYRFLPDGRSVVFMQGMSRHTDFWRLDLSTGHLRQLTDLKPGYEQKSFDVSPDGKEILFDRFRENSDIVLIDLSPR
jgi:serine/threonine protein kinase/Tol biopolymer transport system component